MIFDSDNNGLFDLFTKTQADADAALAKVNEAIKSGLDQDTIQKLTAIWMSKTQEVEEIEKKLQEFKLNKPQ